MSENYLEKLFEHNNWANQQIIRACAALSDDQLDAPPQSATYGTIRSTLAHIASAQKGYLKNIVLPVDERRERTIVPFEELEQSITESGEALLALARDPAGMSLNRQLQTRDDYLVDTWVLVVQIINHATEHREQIKSMLTALGITPPDIDGWGYGFATKSMFKMTAE